MLLYLAGLGHEWGGTVGHVRRPADATSDTAIDLGLIGMRCRPEKSH